MCIILCLQGLDVKASTADIRKFFKCLHIPDGGVYIVGGSLKEAFIAFTTEKDAQLAMHYTGNTLKGSKVTLHISSMAELEHKLKLLLMKNRKPALKQLIGKRPQPSPVKSSRSSSARPIDPQTENLPEPLYPNTANLQTPPVQSLDSSTAFLLDVCTVLHGLQSSERLNEALPGVLTTPESKTLFRDPRTPELMLNSRPGYIRLFGLPASATKEDICNFFKGLSVKEAIMNVKLGLGHCCIVKFADMQNACNALHFNLQPMGSVCVEVRSATEKMWTSAMQECENADNGDTENPRNYCEKIANHRKKSTTAVQLKRQAVNPLPSKAPKRPKHDNVSATATSPTMEYIVIVRNLSKEMTKTEIKELFGCPKIAHQSVLHLLDKERKRTDTAFLIFNSTEAYHYALNLTGCHVGSAPIKVSPISKEKMRAMMAKTNPKNMTHQKMHTLKTPNKNKTNMKMTHQKHNQTWM